MSSRSLLALGAVAILGLASLRTAQASGQGKHPGVVQAFAHDLASIPPGSSPTDAQRQSLAAALGRIFRAVNFPPTVTLNDVADKLAAATAQGQFLAGDLQTLALEITGIAAGSTLFDNVKLASLEMTLLKAGIAPTNAQGLVAGVRALPYSGQPFTVGDTRLVSLQPVDSSVPGYKHAGGDVELDTFVGPSISHGVVTDPSFLSQGVTVNLSQLPLGKYQVSVTIGSNPQPVTLGLVRVRPGPLISEDVAGEEDAPTRERSGRASFGNFYFGQALPTGLSVDDITTVTVTDEQGRSRLTASFAVADTSPLTVTHSAQGHLTATTVAPTAGGSVSAVVEDDLLFAQNGSLLFSAVGLPASTTLTFSINGAAVEPVATGPTGNLYIKTSQGDFPRPPKSTEVVNVLPATVDLFAVTAFAVSDAQGNVLLSSTPEN